MRCGRALTRAISHDVQEVALYGIVGAAFLNGLGGEVLVDVLASGSAWLRLLVGCGTGR